MSSNDRTKALDITFNSGVRQDLESFTAPPGTLKVAYDVEFDKLNRLIRRDGFTQVGTAKYSKTNTVDYPVRRVAQTPRGERLMFTDANVFQQYRVIDKSSEAGLDQQKSSIRTTMESAETISSDEVGALYSTDCAYVNGYYVVAYLQLDVTTGSVNCYVDAIDTFTNARALTHVNLGGADLASQPRVVKCGSTSNNVAILWKDATVNIKKVIVDLGAATLTVPAATNLVTDITAAGGVFDADTMVSGFVLVYAQSVGPKARIIAVDSTGTITASFSWLANGGVANWVPSALAIHGDVRITNEVRATGYDGGTGFIELEITTSALVHSSRARIGAGLGSNAVQMTVIAATASASYLMFSNYASNGVATNPRGHLYVYKVTAGSLTFIYTFANYSLASKCYRDNRNDDIIAFARFDDPSGLQSHILMLDFYANTGTLLNGGYPVMHFGSGRVPLKTANSVTGIGGTADFGSGVFRMAVPLNIGASAISGNQIASYSFQNISTQRFLNAPANNELHIGGGTPLSYDGQRLVENSFYSYPILHSGNIATSNAGGFMPQGVYSYTAVYEWTDALGNRHQSPPCPSVTVDLSAGGFAAGTNTVLITFPCYHPTRKQVPVTVSGTVSDESVPIRVIVYRSVANGSILYRMPIASVNNTASSAANTVISDVYADADISVNEVLYAGPQGRGELATSAPPPTKFLHTHAQRLWGIDCENTERIWCTKTLEQQVNPGYSAALQILIPGAGKINGIAGQDGKLYALATNGIYLASYGDGPDNSGGGFFPTPQLITAAVNCTEMRSVIVASNGIYFVGEDHWGTGIYTIRRGDGEPTSIGLRVRDELATFKTCRGVVDRVDKSQLQFLMVDNDSAPTGSRILCYHYDYLDAEGIGQWTVTRPGAGSFAIESIGIWADGNGAPATVITNSANVGIQSTLATRDIGVPPLPLQIQTNDMRPFGLVGYGRIQGISILNSADATLPDELVIEASYDGGNTWPDLFHYAENTEAGGYPILRRWDSATSKLPSGGSVRLRLSDPRTNVELIPGRQIFHGLSIEVEPLGGNMRLSNIQRG